MVGLPHLSPQTGFPFQVSPREGIPLPKGLPKKENVAPSIAATTTVAFINNLGQGILFPINIHWVSV